MVRFRWRGEPSGPTVQCDRPQPARPVRV